MNKAVVYWQVRSIVQKDWKWMVLAALSMAIKYGYPSQQHVPFASTTAANFLLTVFAISMPVLVARSERTITDIPFLKSRPLDASQMWPWRLLKTFLFVTLLSWTITPLFRGQLAEHANQVLVGGCEAIARYEAAGFVPSFSIVQDNEAYARFRAGQQTTEACDKYANLTLPGLDARLRLLCVLAVLLSSVAAVIADTFGSRSWRERVKLPIIWVALIPLIVSMFLMVLNLARMIFTDTGHLSMLYLYENTGIISVSMLLITAVYLVIAHRAWRQMEVMG